MLKDITLGQFFPGKSIIHRLDPRTKLLLLIVYIVALFLAKSWCSYGLVLVFLTTVTCMGRIPFKAMTRGLKPMLVFIIFTAVLNLFYTKSGTLLLDWWIFEIWSDGIITAFFMVMRIMMLVCGTFLLTYTTSPIALTDGLESLFKPLSRIGFPAHELAMMMSIALRFIPTLIEETNKITQAQKARGADFESGNLISRAKAMVPLLVPLFVSAFRRAGDLAMAMESRCYHGGDGRTRLRVLKITKNDWIACGAMAVLLALIVLEGIFL